MRMRINRKVLICVSGLVLLILGAFYYKFFSGESKIRVATKSSSPEDKVDMYNDVANLWNGHGRGRFESQSLHLFVDDTEYPLKKEKKPQHHWPENDVCSSATEDPLKCAPFEPLAYVSRNVNLGKSSVIKVMNGEKVVFKRRVSSVKYFAFDGCTPYSKECQRCTINKGVWNGTVCAVPKYLNSMCFRLREDSKGAFHLDREDEGNQVYLNADVGCNHAGLNPYSYSSKKPSKVPVTIRYYADPYIAMSYLSSSCHFDITKKPQQQNCFGIPASGKQSSMWFRPITALLTVIFAIGRLIKTILILFLLGLVFFILWILFFNTNMLIVILNRLLVVVQSLQNQYSWLTPVSGFLLHIITIIEGSAAEEEESEPILASRPSPERIAVTGFSPVSSSNDNSSVQKENTVETAESSEPLPDIFEESPLNSGSSSTPK